MEKYLKDESYYADRHDVGTIKECLRFIDVWIKKEPAKPEGMTKEQFLHALNISLYFKKGERFRAKATFVQELMSRDKDRDERLLNARAPVGIRCPNCFQSMEVTLKQLHEGLDGALRALFMFECRSCERRRGVFDNGDEFKAKVDPCPQCGAPVKTSCSEKGRALVWTKNCEKCGFKETDVDDFEKMEKEHERRELEDAELLRKHRAEFCLSPEKGEEYLEAIRNLDAMKNILEQAEKRQTDPDYKKAGTLRKLSVFESQKTLAEVLEKENYQKLSFEKPEIGRFIIMPFLVLDADSSRKEADSAQKLRRLIKKTLEETNWRLMSEGISYKLGCFSGRLKGYEAEEDLVQLVKSENGKKGKRADERK